MNIHSTESQATRMAETTKIPFEDADDRKGTILTVTGAICFLLAWLLRPFPIAVALVTMVTVFLMTGNRYQWIWIWRRTFIRDLIGFYIVSKTLIRIAYWEKINLNVVRRWNYIWEQHPDKPAFLIGDRQVTFREGEECSNRVACYFKRQGFKRGEVIALYMATQPEYVFLWLGLAKLGVVTALVNNNIKGSQLKHCLTVVKCKALIFGDEMVNAITELQEDLKDIPFFQFNSPDRESTPILPDTAALASELRDMPTTAVTDGLTAKPRDTLLYIYTSGTTGLPKAAIITNLRFLLIPMGVYHTAGLSADDVFYDPLPLHHTAGGVLGCGQALLFGLTVALRTKFSATNYWKDTIKYKCTVAQYIGEMCRYVLSTPPSPADCEHKVKVIVGNGLRPQIWEHFVKRFNIRKVMEFYGATEGNSNLVNMDSEVGAIGFLSRPMASLYPMILVKCDQITGEILRAKNGFCIMCGPNEPGLLLGKIDPRRALTTFSGYADKTASEKKMVKNVRVQDDCYFNTGDVMVMDHYGYIFFKDRTGDTFRWRGENVSTAEVEGVISSLAELKDAVVYGVTIPNIEGKAGMAAISDPDRIIDIKALGKTLKNNLPPYAVPLFVKILTNPPLTATFKLIKKDLIEEGFKLISDSEPIYFLDQELGEYVPLTPSLYDDIMEGRVKL